MHTRLTSFGQQSEIIPRLDPIGKERKPFELDPYRQALAQGEGDLVLLKVRRYTADEERGGGLRT